MPDKPTVDNLKLERDGHLAAGSPAPLCNRCGTPIAPDKVLVLNVVEVTGRKRTVIAYACPTCEQGTHLFGDAHV